MTRNVVHNGARASRQGLPAARHSFVIGFWVAAAILLCSVGNAGKFIVRFRGEKVKTVFAQQWAARRGASIERALKIHNCYLVSSLTPPSKVLAEWKADPAVLYVAPLRYLRPCETIPNDPLFAQQWQFRNVANVGADIRATSAWDTTTGSQHIVLAVVDSGLQLNHPDFENRVWVNPGEIPGNGKDDDNNGFVDDINGWNFYTGSPDVGPTLGHGTSVASQVGAATNNALGVAGLNWNSPLMILNIFSPTGWATDADAADAIVYACDNGARVINASWGSPGYSPIIADAVAYARSKNVLICAAAGNYSFDADAHPFYPAAIGSDALLSVGGTTNQDGWIYNYGIRSVQISAPALMVYLARYPGTYGYGSGTSFAAPLVTGAAGLVLARWPNLDAATLRMRLIASATPLEQLQERNVANGRLDAAAAVSIQQGEPVGRTELHVVKAAAYGAIIEIARPDDVPVTSPLFVQLKIANEPITGDNYPMLAEKLLTQLPAGRKTVRRLVRGLEPETTYWFAARPFAAGGATGELTSGVLTTPPCRRIFYDPCDTTLPVWQATGFVLAGGSTHSGTLAWQDSPEGDYTSGSVARLRGGPFDVRSLVRPRLSFYLEYFFPSRNAEGDRLEVRVSHDGGATWQTHQRFRATTSPPRRFSIPLDVVPPTSQLFVEFVCLADENSFVDDGVYLDDIAIEEGLGDLPFADDLIIEACDFWGEQTEPPGFQLAGVWQKELAKSSAPRLVGTASFSVSGGSPGAEALFVPFFPASGIYEVFLTYPNAANGVPLVRIRHDEGDTTFPVTQQSATANRWLSLGEYHFSYGRDATCGSVALDASAASTQTKVYVDAIRFLLKEADSESLAAKDWLRFE
ncbi:MAG: S8 family serine peptidase [Candidatus Sumerlaeaceae bacterium]|nr:S8 family serine peptidase [Candidatus Sumerlaeaceae bacterium]